MPTPEKHALLSASSAERWMNCTRAPRLEETLPEKTSEYAEEGRLAHAIAELKVRKKYVEPIGPRKFSNAMKKLKEHPLYNDEMQGYTDQYLEFIDEVVMRYEAKPYIALEQQLDFSTFVPEGFGTGDCLTIGGDTLEIIDFKYGKGVAVSADENPQMRLYAVGALLRYAPIYGDRIKRVRMSIVQPRLNSISTVELSRDDLMNWVTFDVKPKAQLAFKGEGEFAPGEWCRFCRAKSICRARTDVHTALEDFKGALPPLLTNDQVGEVLNRAQNLKKWVTDLEEYALSSILQGKDIAGWKAVEGRSNRQFYDTEVAFDALNKNGYDDALLYTRKPITLTEVEKLLGKKSFDTIMSEYVTKAPGKPTLAPISDKREPYNVTTAVKDFAEITPVQ